MSDYISREAAIEKIRVAAGCAECAGSSSALCVCNVCDVYNAIRLIKSLPAADVEPVRHGNWNIRLADEMTLCLECSICGRKVDNIDLHNLLEAGEYGEACRRYPYCHCGAKMKLEDNNGT